MIMTSPRLYFRDRYIVPPLAICVILLAVAWWYTLSKIPVATEQVYLHYNIIFGIDQYGPRSLLFYPLLFGLGTLLINTALSFAAFKYDRIIARLIMTITALIMLFLLVGLIFIVGLNI